MAQEWRGPVGGVLVFAGIIAGVAFAFRDPPAGVAPPLSSASGSSSVVPRTHPVAPASVPLTVLPVDSARVAPRASQPAPSTECPNGSTATSFVEPMGPQRKMKGCAHVADSGDSIREGFWTITLPSGESTEGRYVNGVKDGRWITWYPNGTAARTEEYKLGRYEGVFVEWSPQGQRLAELEFHDNLRDGTSTFWLEDGTTRREIWKKGRRIDPPEPDGGV